MISFDAFIKLHEHKKLMLACLSVSAQIETGRLGLLKAYRVTVGAHCSSTGNVSVTLRQFP